MKNLDNFCILNELFINLQTENQYPLQTLKDITQLLNTKDKFQYITIQTNNILLDSDIINTCNILLKQCKNYFEKFIHGFIIIDYQSIHHFHIPKVIIAIIHKFGNFKNCHFDDILKSRIIQILFYISFCKKRENKQVINGDTISTLFSILRNHSTIHVKNMIINIISNIVSDHKQIVKQYASTYEMACIWIDILLSFLEKVEELYAMDANITNHNLCSNSLSTAIPHTTPHSTHIQVIRLLCNLRFEVWIQYFNQPIKAKIIKLLSLITFHNDGKPTNYMIWIIHLVVVYCYNYDSKSIQLLCDAGLIQSTVHFIISNNHNKTQLNETQHYALKTIYYVIKAYPVKIKPATLIELIDQDLANALIGTITCQQDFYFQQSQTSNKLIAIHILNAIITEYQIVRYLFTNTCLLQSTYQYLTILKPDCKYYNDFIELICLSIIYADACESDIFQYICNQTNILNYVLTEIKLDKLHYANLKRHSFIIKKLKNFQSNHVCYQS